MRRQLGLTAAALLLFAGQPGQAGPLNWAGKVSVIPGSLSAHGVTDGAARIQRRQYDTAAHALSSAAGRSVGPPFRELACSKTNENASPEPSSSSPLVLVPLDEPSTPPGSSPVSTAASSSVVASSESTLSSAAAVDVLSSTSSNSDRPASYGAPADLPSGTTIRLSDSESQPSSTNGPLSRTAAHPETSSLSILRRS